jgi:hypothetical protein
LSSILATNTLTLVFVFKVTFTQVAALTGYFLLGVGCCAWITSASARVYGKRHTYVFGSLLLVAGSIWGAVGMILMHIACIDSSSQGLSESSWSEDNAGVRNWSV